MSELITAAFSIPDTSLLIQGEYSPWLVALSIAIAIFASFMGFQVAEQARESSVHKRRHLLLLTGSLALGGGIWAMHFLGMLAFNLCTPVEYNAKLTTLSAFPGIAAAWVALRQLTEENISLRQILIGGLLVGAGIGTMHYTGMAAMQMAPLLRYHLPLFLLSILVAVVLAMLALYIRFGLTRLQGKGPTSGLTLLLASLVMGLAISGMHYTGMSAARFVKPPGLELSEQTAQISYYLATAVSLITLALITLVLGISFLFKFKDASSKAIHNERMQKAIADTAIDGILTVNSKGIVIRMNPAVTRILGWEEQDLIGRSILQVVPESRRYLYGSNFFEKLDAANASNIIGESRDVEALNREGDLVPVRVGVGVTQFNGDHYFVAFIADIRQRIEMEQALKDNEAKFRSFIQNIPGIAYRCLDEPSWPMVFISDAVEEITGYPASAFELPDPQVSFIDLYHPDDLEVIEQALTTSDQFDMEYRIYHKDGSIRWVREHGVFVHDEQGEVIWLDGFIMDISARRQMEDELRDAKGVAEQAAAARTAFLANMSHEIRTPMNAIIGFSDLLLDEPMAPAQLKHLNTINRSARSLLHLLNDILDSAKLDKGKLELDYRDFNLGNEIDTVVSTFWLEARKKGLDLEIVLSPDLAICYHGVPERIRQVLSNIVGNAVKFTGEGKVTLAVEPENQNGVKFTITDTGIGMSEEQLSRVFEAFSQADASMSRKYGGTGLGTTISKQLVELMGGTITVSSALESGSCFTFTLPLKEVSMQAAKAELARTSLPPLNILVVDDIAQNIDLLEVMLSREGHTVTSVTNGQEALDILVERGFDVVLMDLQMPVLDGLSASRLRREYEAENNLPPTPIVALTASVLMQDKHEARAAGMEGFANKPVDLPVLSEEIARVLNIHVQVPAADSVQSTDKSAVINRKLGERLWGSRQRHQEELERFMRDSVSKMAQLESAIAEQDWPAVVSISHGLKGIAGNLALSALTQALKTLESAAQSQKEIDEALDVLLEAMAEAKAAIETGSTHESKAQEEQTEFEKDEFIAHLQQLQESASRNQLDDSEVEILSTLAKGDYKDEVDAILSDIEDFEFDSASHRITSLLEMIENEHT